jgi:hypothetical protein
MLEKYPELAAKLTGDDAIDRPLAIAAVIKLHRPVVEQPVIAIRIPDEDPCLN